MGTGSKILDYREIQIKYISQSRNFKSELIHLAINKIYTFTHAKSLQSVLIITISVSLIYLLYIIRFQNNNRKSPFTRYIHKHFVVIWHKFSYPNQAFQGLDIPAFCWDTWCIAPCYTPDSPGLGSILQQCSLWTLGSRWLHHAAAHLLGLQVGSAPSDNSTF